MTREPSAQAGCVLYIGAGLASDLDSYLARDPDRIVLVEPNPALKDDLALLCEAHEGVRHLPYGITATGGARQLTVYNLFDISSFSEPLELLEHYPGAVVDKSPIVQTLTPDDLLPTLDLPAGVAHTLVIDTPGSEFEILDAFARGGALALFENLILTLPNHPLFKGHERVADIPGLLEAAGYGGPARQDDPANPDWRTETYRFDPNIGRLHALRARIEELEANARTDRAALSAAEADAETANEALSRLKSEAKAARKSAERHKSRRRALQADLREARAALAAQTEAGAAARDSRDALQARLEESEARASALQAELDRAGQGAVAQSGPDAAHYKALKADHADVTRALEALRADHAALTERMQASDAALSASDAISAQQSDTIAALEAELRSVRAEAEETLAELNRLRWTHKKALVESAARYTAFADDIDIVQQKYQIALRQRDVLSERVRELEATRSDLSQTLAETRARAKRRQGKLKRKVRKLRAGSGAGQRLADENGQST